MHRDTVCISRMPIGTRGKFAGTRTGRRGSQAARGRRGVFGKGGAPMIYGNVTGRHIERRPGWHCQGAHRVLSPSYSLRDALPPLPTPLLSRRVYVHIIVTGNPGRPALISSTLRLPVEMTCGTRALSNLGCTIIPYFSNARCTTYKLYLARPLFSIARDGREKLMA